MNDTTCTCSRSGGRHLKGCAALKIGNKAIRSQEGRRDLRAFLGTDPALGGVSITALADRLYARGLRAPKR